MKLLESDIKTREVLGWSGLHLFHHPGSSCSQKVRIVMNLKGVVYAPHLVDLLTNANLSAYYLGINPRGLVPTLVHDGDVHIESNDILAYLEGVFPDPPLVPPAFAEEVAMLLRHEDALHLDLRTITLRFIAPSHPPKSHKELERYATLGSGTVGGTPDPDLHREIAFWAAYGDHGISDQTACRSVQTFRTAFDELEQQLTHGPYLLGDTLSVLDVAWLIYVNRLQLAGYPLRRLHPGLGEWFDRLSAQSGIAPEIAPDPEFAAYVRTQQAALVAAGRTMETICGL
jgi:glutathione S-transferase